MAQASRDLWQQHIPPPFPFPSGIFTSLVEEKHEIPRPSRRQTEPKAAPGWKKGKKLIKSGKKSFWPCPRIRVGWESALWVEDPELIPADLRISGCPWTLGSATNTWIAPAGKMNPPGISRPMDQPFPPSQMATATPSNPLPVLPVQTSTRMVLRPGGLQELLQTMPWKEGAQQSQSRDPKRSAGVIPSESRTSNTSKSSELG